jgi:nitrate reductase NapA
MLTRRNFLKNSVFLSIFANNSFANLFDTYNINENMNQRIKNPLLKNKEGDFKEISWRKAYDILEEQIINAHTTSGVNGIGLYTNANISIVESYALSKLFKAGFRTNNILVDSYNDEDIHAYSKKLIYGIGSNSGSKDDMHKADVILDFDNTDTIQTVNKRTKIINISTTHTYKHNAFINLFIKEASYSYVIKYLTNEYLKSEFFDINYLKKHIVFANLKDEEQWEISFKQYKKSFKKYTIDYLIENTKQKDTASNSIFKDNILSLKSLVLNNSNKVVSLSSSQFNMSNKSLEANILLESLHLLMNKHSRPGCGFFNISTNKSFTGSIDLVGLNSDRLPANRYIKYDEHQEITNNFWNIPKGTLNPIKSSLEKNITDKITKFLWVQESPTKLSIDFSSNRDLFIVSSSVYLNENNKNANLILPTTLEDESSSLLGNEFRQVEYIGQNKIPYKNSMSLLWQTIELSKRFTIKQMYKKVKVHDSIAVKNVIREFRKIGFSKETKLFDVFFNNSKLKEFTQIDTLNTEVNSDSRFLIGSDGGIFRGYKYNIQEYLFEEFRQFTLGNGHDLLSYSKYKNANKKISWPVINQKEIIYRFNPIDDIYAKKSVKLDKQFSFYGRMNQKNLPFGNLEKITSEETKSLKYRAKIFTTPSE